VNASEELAADLVIVGSHGRSEVDRILLGSVSSFVVSHSKVSVMVVRV
jgi:nucleotide-binding universal stress UspA family protein